MKNKEQFCVVDIETGSPHDIKRGDEPYFGPGSHILVICWKIIGQKKIYSFTNFDRREKIQIPKELKNFKGTFIAHKWSFECTAFRKFAPGTRLANPENWLCTQALAHRFNLPSNLESLANILKLTHRKNPDGRRLISTYSIPNKRTGKFSPIPHDDFQPWINYCTDDILPTEEAFLKLFPMWTKEERRVFDLDRQINAYGIPIDIKGAKRIEKALAKLMVNAEVEAENLAGRTKHGPLIINSPIAFKNWINDRRPTGGEIENARAETIEALKQSILIHEDKAQNDDILQAIELREILAARSIGKTDALLRGVSLDGRYRYGQIYHVAHTGRWQSWGVNFYNFPRNSCDSKKWDEILKSVEQKPTLDAIISLQRGLIKAPKGKTFVVSDYAGIENRILLWLAQDTAQLKRIAAGEPPYLIFAEKLYPDKKVTKADTALYTKAKAAVLGLGYHQGAAKFALMNNYDLSEAQHIVDVWRGSHPGVTKLWRDFDAAFRNAITGGEATVAGVKFAKRKYTRTVEVTLPDRHTLYYRGAHLRPSKKFEGQMEICALFGKSETPITVHGGTLTENIVQAIASRLLRGGLLKIDCMEIQTVLHVYDEIVNEVSKKLAKAEAKIIAMSMTDVPEWAKGLPLAVEQKITERWIK